MADFKNQKFLGTIDIDVSLETVYHGATSQPLKVNYTNLNSECKICLGVGSTKIKCDTCKATGERFERVMESGVSVIKYVSCKDCSGTGAANKNCEKCNEVYEFDFALERGFPLGKIQRFELKDRKANMNLRIINSRHNIYQRVQGAPQHLATTYIISLEQAVGLKPFEFKLPHISGEASKQLEFKSELGKIYRDGDVHRFPGAGLPVYRSGGVDKEKEKEVAFGDCLVLFQVEFPNAEWFSKPGRNEKWKALFE